MSSSSAQHVLLSPSELAYLHTSLSLDPPLRPDGRLPNQFRPLVAETGILPGTNGSARICFADGTEAIVGAKAEVERTRARYGPGNTLRNSDDDNDDEEEEEEEDEDEDGERGGPAGETDWVELTVEIPGYRDDDANTVFLAAMLSEALLADGTFTRRLRINRRFHWKLYLDILLISPPLSYPLPLLSLTTHLALLATRLPRLKSEGDEDPFFDDDWDSSTYLYTRKGGRAVARPPVTLLVMAVGLNIVFDPSKEELAVADVALAVSIGEEAAAGATAADPADKAKKSPEQRSRSLRLLSVRTIDPPSRLTPPGVPNAAGDPTATAAAAAAAASSKQSGGGALLETEPAFGVWRAPRGGAKVAMLSAMIQKVMEKGGIADEVLDGLDGVELG